MALQLFALGRNYTIERDPITRLCRATITIHDQHVRDAGQWADVDERLVVDGQDGFAWKLAMARHALRLAENGARRWYPRREVLGEYIEFGIPQRHGGGTWPNLILGTPTISGNALVWSQSGYSLSVQPNWHRVKLEVILNNATAAAAVGRLRWPMTLVGLARSGYDLIGRDEVIVGQISRPFADDANRVRFPVTPTITGGYIEFNADLIGAVFPVTIDPTLTLGDDPGELDIDGYLSGNQTGYNYGIATAILIGYPEAVQNYNRRTGLLKADLSPLVGATINSATLSLFHAVGGWTNYGTITCHRVMVANDGWVEGNKNGDWAGNEPCWDYLDRTAATYWAGHATRDGCSVPGTDYVAAAMGTSVLGDHNCVAGHQHDFTLDTTQFTSLVAANYGMPLVQTSEVAAWDAASSDHATTGYRPRLVVDYTAGGGLAIPVAMQLRRGQGVS